MSDAEKCDLPNFEHLSTCEGTLHTNTQEYFNGGSEHQVAVRNEENDEDLSDPMSPDDKSFTAMDGELDFEDETLSPQKTEKTEDQISLTKNEATPKERAKSSTESGTDKEREREDGQCTPEKKANETKDSIEDGEDDGECSDDDDLEEGELKERDETLPKEKARQVCRFFNRGQCFYGMQCRFLHLNNFNKGNYNMFAPPPKTFYEPQIVVGGMGLPGHGMHRSPRTGPDFLPVPPLLPLPPSEIPEESAWEKGLREAKELVKKANKRKEEPDFEDKRLNLSLTNSGERNTNDKENDAKPYKKKREENDVLKYEPNYFDTPYERDSRMNFGGRYENFEIRYTDRATGDRGRSRMQRKSNDERVDKVPRFNQRGDNMGNWRNDRVLEVQKARGESYFDPWRRSKSPKHNRRSRDRSRSLGSYSSVSSYSSRSSCSYSRSSSRSSRGSSRSPPPDPQQKKKNPPNHILSPPEGPKKFIALRGKKKKPGARTSSSRSRSLSRGRSIYSSSRSSRSISMDSVSSASSSISHSSLESLGRQNEHMSILRKEDEKTVEKSNIRDGFSAPPPSAIYFPMSCASRFEKQRAKEILANIGIPDNQVDPIREKFEMSQATLPVFVQQSVQHLIPNVEKERPKEPIKGLYPPKQQIKLTLLNKNPQCKLTNLPKKDLEVNKVKQPDEVPKISISQLSAKRPLSPPAPVIITKPPAITPKKSASSRRDELLKQLKAVEDAIARKRAKFC